MDVIVAIGKRILEILPEAVIIENVAFWLILGHAGLMTSFFEKGIVQTCSMQDVLYVRKED